MAQVTGLDSNSWEPWVPSDQFDAANTLAPDRTLPQPLTCQPVFNPPRHRCPRGERGWLHAPRQGRR